MTRADWLVEELSDIPTKQVLMILQDHWKRFELLQLQIKIKTDGTDLDIEIEYRVKMKDKYTKIYEQLEIHCTRLNMDMNTTPTNAQSTSVAKGH